MELEFTRKDINGTYKLKVDKANKTRYLMGIDNDVQIRNELMEKFLDDKDILGMMKIAMLERDL